MTRTSQPRVFCWEQLGFSELETLLWEYTLQLILLTWPFMTAMDTTIFFLQVREIPGPGSTARMAGGKGFDAFPDVLFLPPSEPSEDMLALPASG